MNDISIRDFLTEDTQSVIAVYKSAMLSPPWNEDLSQDLLMDRFSQDQARANFICRVAQKNIGNVIGAMWHEKTDLNILERERGSELVNELVANGIINDIGWFRDLVINSEHQSQGIGKKLVMDAIDIWKRQGYQNILLRIHLGGYNNDVPANIKAIRLHESLGFKLLKTTKISKDINQHELKMGYMWLKI